MWITYDTQYGYDTEAVDEYIRIVDLPANISETALQDLIKVSFRIVNVVNRPNIIMYQVDRSVYISRFPDNTLIIRANMPWQRFVRYVSELELNGDFSR